MFYEAELRFLRDIFKSCRIQTSLVDFTQPLNTRQDLGLLAYFRHLTDTERPLRDMLPPVEPCVVYRLTDPLFCQYMYLLLPDIPGQILLLIGPFLPSTPTPEQITEWACQSGITSADQQQLMEYYRSTPVLPPSSHLFAVLDTFSERLWGANNYVVEQVDRESLSVSLSLQSKTPAQDEQDMLWNVKNMEMRYSYENELMNAVTKGQVHKADMLLNTFSTFSFEQRLSDPVRNAKNYCIIMNTLLRKAAENGGVHPVYLDGLSSEYAARIETLGSTNQVAALMSEIFRGYCLLVRSHSVKDYSPPVQKVITLIDSDLTGDLTLHNFAKILNVSGSYLSTLFKKETGHTLTEFINDRRIKYAAHLLTSTKLQIQTIAQHCGIVDVQYFSKVFKRITGKTPKEYRESLKR